MGLGARKGVGAGLPFPPLRFYRERCIFSCTRGHGAPVLFLLAWLVGYGVIHRTL